MAYCKFCDKEVEPALKKNRYYCPDCNKYVKVTKEEKTEPLVKEIPQEKEELEEREPKHYKKKEPEVVQEGPAKLIMNPKTIKYDAADLHMGEILINLGFAKDLNDLARKNMKLSYSLLNMGALGKQVNAMETNKEKETKSEDTSEIIDKSLKQQLLQAQIDNMKKGSSTDPLMKAYIESMKKENPIDPLSTMMMVRMLDNQGSGKDSKDNNFMDKMLQLQMMKSMSGGENQNVVALQRELADMKMMQQMQQMQKAPTLQDQMVALEKIRADRDTRVKEAEMDAQKQRDQTLKITMDSKLKDLEKSIEEARKSSGVLGAQRLKELKEEVKAVKEMSHELGDKEKGAGEYIADTVGKLGEQIGPALMDMAKQKREQSAMQPQQMPPEVLQEVPPQPLQEPPPQSPELTPSEQDMMGTMDDMYIKERK